MRISRPSNELHCTADKLFEASNTNRPGSATTMSASAPTSKEPLRSRKRKCRAGPSQSILTTMVGDIPRSSHPVQNAGSKDSKPGPPEEFLKILGLDLRSSPHATWSDDTKAQWPAAICV